MKYLLIIFFTAVIVFLGATVYYKGLPAFLKGQTPVVSQAVVTPSPSPVATSDATQKADENISIVSAIQAALVAEHGSDAASLNITISKIEGDYAEGAAGEQGGGGMWFAAKVNGDWKLVWDGNGTIACTDLSPYPNFPKDMIPQCWDASGSPVTR
jgi:hypothetical protein